MDVAHFRKVCWAGFLCFTLGLASAGCQAPPIQGGVPTTAAGSPTLPAASAAPAQPPAETPLPPAETLASPTAASPEPSTAIASATEPQAATSTATPASTAQPSGKVPNFSHIIVIVLENREYGSVIGKTEFAPVINELASKSTLLTQYYGVTHPSLPNYIAMISGDTFGIQKNCEDCFINAPNLADLIEASGRTWRTYQEDLPSPCFIGSQGDYAQKHNPFVYFDSIRLNSGRCQHNVVPLDWMSVDLASGSFPDFAFIVPNLCNSGHDCTLTVADTWLRSTLDEITASPTYDANTLIVVTFDEGQGNHSCCGLGAEAGGRVATLLISPLVEAGLQDGTPYSHYSLLKTIAAAWGLEELGHAADPETTLIAAPWKTP